MSCRCAAAQAQGRPLVSHDDLPAAVGQFADIHPHGFLGQDILDELGPLHEARVPAIEILVASHVVGFAQPLDALEVEVIYGLSLAVLIFVDDGEGG